MYSDKKVFMFRLYIIVLLIRMSCIYVYSFYFFFLIFQIYIVLYTFLIQENINAIFVCCLFICISFRNWRKSQPLLSELFCLVLRQMQRNNFFTNNVHILSLSCNLKKCKTIAKFS
jgi:hypothetical protein